MYASDQGLVEGVSGACLAGPDGSNRNTCQVQLHGVEGHTVVFADGRRLGRVAWMEYESRTDQPDALIVRRRFYERPVLVRLPSEIVVSVERDQQIIRLDVPYN